MTAYRLARGYLPSLKIAGVTDGLVERYLNPTSLKTRPMTKQGLYQRILESAQNANMKAGVIGRSIGGVGNLAVVLHEFSPDNVLEEYGNDWQRVLEDIVRTVKPRGQIRMTPRSIWPHYCQTILSAAPSCSSSAPQKISSPGLTSSTMMTERALASRCF